LKKNDAFIERRIITGLILNTEFCEKLEPLLKIKWLKSEESKRLASWCISYFKKYKKAPSKEIENIYADKSESLDDDVADLIEETLFSLSEEYKKSKKFNVDYLLDLSEKYIKKRQLQDLINNAQIELDNGDLLEATTIASEFKPIERVISNATIPLSSAKQIRKTFEDQFTPLFTYGDTPLGRLVNRSFCRGCFVGFMGSNKSGKSMMLMDISMKAAFAGRKVIYFQAGDMTEAQQMRRQGIWLLKKSDLSEYCQELFIPVLDCVYSQIGTCKFKKKRRKNPPFRNHTEAQIRGESQNAEINNLAVSKLKAKVRSRQNYTPCIDCTKSTNPKKQYHFLGTIWYKIRPPVDPLHWKEIFHTVTKKYLKKMNNIRLITYGNETLTMSKVVQEWNILEKTGFTPDVCVIDYMDILAADSDTKNLTQRDQINKIWQRGRALSTDKNACVVVATQADAASFDTKLLKKKNFSDDKRKLDHTTDMFGINMTEIEKEKGILRINSLVSRETDGSKVVYVGQRFQIGRPILFSYY